MLQRFLVSAMIALAVSGCGRKAEGQTVAVVNGDEITATELNNALAGANVGADASQDVRNQVLQQLISRRLLAQQARKDGIDKSPDFVNRQRQLTEELLINMLVSRQVNTSQVPSPAEISSFEAGRPEIFGKREIWTLDQLVYPKPKADLEKKVAAVHSLDDITKLLTANGIQFTRASRQVDTAVFPHAIYQQVAALPQGEPFVAQGPDRSIASVITDRKPNPLAADKTRELALAGLRRQQTDKVIDDRVKNLKASAKIEYQAGFGPPKK